MMGFARDLIWHVLKYSNEKNFTKILCLNGHSGLDIQYDGKKVQPKHTCKINNEKLMPTFTFFDCKNVENLALRSALMVISVNILCNLFVYSYPQASYGIQKMEKFDGHALVVVHYLYFG